MIEKTIARPGKLWVGWLHWSCELVALLTIAGFLVFDRVRLFQEYLTKFIDEDQGIQWYAAREFLRGHIHEPCFFGQSYNSNIEGMLAAPLVAMSVPYVIAVPLVTVVLGVLPFLLMAWIAWRRRQTVVAGLSLLLPVALSTRYGIITGMPRGFVTGDALAILPALLFLPPFRKNRRPPQQTPTPEKPLSAENGLSPHENSPSASPLSFGVHGRTKRWSFLTSWLRLFLPPPLHLRRSCPKSRYFFAAFFAVVALMLNPNCAILLAAVAVYGLLTTFREWRFWLFTVLGLIAAAPYPLLVYYFYYVWHDDYRLYQRQPPKNFDWSWTNYHEFVRSFSDISFHDLLPDPLYHTASVNLHTLRTHYHDLITPWMMRNPASMAFMVLFGVAIVLLLIRLRVSAVLAALVAIALVFVSFAYSRIQDGRTSVSFPYSRMFLAVPVLWIWLLMLINPPRLTEPHLQRKPWRWWQWTRRWVFSTVAMLMLLACALSAGEMAVTKNKALAGEIEDINENAQVARPVSVEETEHIAKAIQAVADKEHLSLVLISGYDGRKWDYTLPELTTCETLFPTYERRTWRLVEECYPRYDKILVLGNLPRLRSAKFPTHTIIQRDPPLILFPMNGQSVETFCREMGANFRFPFFRPKIPTPPTVHATPAPPATSRPTTRYWWQKQ